MIKLFHKILLEKVEMNFEESIGEEVWACFCVRESLTKGRSMCKDRHSARQWGHTPLIPALGTKRQVDLISESSRSAWSTEQVPVLQGAASWFPDAQPRNNHTGTILFKSLLDLLALASYLVTLTS